MRRRLSHYGGGSLRREKRSQEGDADHERLEGEETREPTYGVARTAGARLPTEHSSGYRGPWFGPSAT